MNLPFVRRRGLVLALLVCAGVCLGGCSESPTEVFERARAAVEKKDFEAFAATLTERSASLLRRLRDIEESSKGRYRYMDAKDFLKLIPVKGEVQEVYEDGNLVQLRIGKNEKTTEEVILLREMDGWRIDILDSPRFWLPLTFLPAKKESES